MQTLMPSEVVCWLDNYILNHIAINTIFVQHQLQPLPISWFWLIDSVRSRKKQFRCHHLICFLSRIPQAWALELVPTQDDIKDIGLPTMLNNDCSGHSGFGQINCIAENVSLLAAGLPDQVFDHSSFALSLRSETGNVELKFFFVVALPSFRFHLGCSPTQIGLLKP